MKRAPRSLATLALALVLSACTTEFTYTDIPCRFVFNMNRHLISPALQSAVGGRGVYCKVTTTIKGGASYFHFQTNDGLEDDVPFIEEDKRMTLILGSNGALWFGFSNIDTDNNGQPVFYEPVFYAYDAECPNCFDPSAIPVRSHPLQVASTGIATCPTCHRTYNMNTGGNRQDGDPGAPLRRFRRSSYSTAGIVSIGT